MYVVACMHGIWFPLHEIAAMYCRHTRWCYLELENQATLFNLLSPKKKKSFVKFWFQRDGHLAVREYLSHFVKNDENIQSNHQIITAALACSTFPRICRGSSPRDVQKLKKTKGRVFFPLTINLFVTHQRLVFNLLADEFVFTQGIARLSCDGVYGSFLHLLFDGTEQHEERLASTLLCFGREPRD